MNMKLSVQYFQIGEQDALEMKLVTITTPLSHTSDEYIHIAFKNNVVLYNVYCTCYCIRNQ